MIALERLRDALGASTEVEDDLEEIRDEVVALWESTTGRPWNRREAHRQTFALSSVPEPRRRRVWLDLRPVDTVATVEEHDGEAWVAIEGSVLLDVSTGELLAPDGGTFPELVRVTYSGGYTDETVPPDIRKALLLQAAYGQARHASDKLIVRSQAFESGSTSFLDAELHPAFERAAKRHRS